MDHMDPAVRTDDELARKALERIEVIESAGYVFPERFGRGDWITAGFVIVATIVWLIAGVWM